LNIEAITLAQYIEHTLLKPDTDTKAITQLCKEAVENNFSGVCVPPYFVSLATELLEETSVNIVTVIGFPMGYAATPAKVEEAKRAIQEGADEIDVVVNIAAIKDKNWSYVKNDINSLTTVAHLQGKIVKIIFETALLTEEEIKRLCKICNENEVNYVKTATGFNGVNTSPEIIRLLKHNINAEIKIKASGGIHTRAQALALIEAGASRIGASRSLQIIE
jgi:deoxyribose-phosphate aldolase|tara:strand:- start:1083 stop:1742 length:660 start_codon:yes stop_codon:yes gene_type:complete